MLRPPRQADAVPQALDLSDEVGGQVAAVQTRARCVLVVVGDDAVLDEPPQRFHPGPLLGLHLVVRRPPAAHDSNPLLDW